MLIGGVLYLSVNGESLRVKGDFRYFPGGAKREPIVGQDGVHGYSEQPQAPYIEGSITKDITSKLRLAEIAGTANATVTLKLKDSTVFVLKNAFCANDGETMDLQNGEYKVRFYGEDSDEFQQK